MVGEQYKSIDIMYDPNQYSRVNSNLFLIADKTKMLPFGIVETLPVTTHEEFCFVVRDFIEI
jgi:hypothetical protein